MSHLEAEAMVREFYYRGIRIPDPGPGVTVDQVRGMIMPAIFRGCDRVGVRYRSRRVGSRLNLFISGLARQLRSINRVSSWQNNNSQGAQDERSTNQGAVR